MAIESTNLSFGGREKAEDEIVRHGGRPISSGPEGESDMRSPLLCVETNCDSAYVEGGAGRADVGPIRRSKHVPVVPTL
jgi:hypothetical protein